MRAFYTLQAAEIWTLHGDWITRHAPAFGPCVSERFEQASRVQATDVAPAADLRERLRHRIAEMLPPGAVICLPNVPGTLAAAIEAFRSKAMRSLCIAGLACVPQASIPVIQVDGCPPGLSLMRGAGADRSLLDFPIVHDLRDQPASAEGVKLPDVMAEVQAAFARYEKALTHNEVGALDHLFWHRSNTVRYGAAENLVGYAEIRAFRAARPAAGLARILLNTYGRDCTTACIKFTRNGIPRVGRQTQAWILTGDGWKVGAAHVSVIDPP